MLSNRFLFAIVSRGTSLSVNLLFELLFSKEFGQNKCYPECRLPGKLDSDSLVPAVPSPQHKAEGQPAARPTSMGA